MIIEAGAGRVPLRVGPGLEMCRWQKRADGALFVDGGKKNGRSREK